MTVSPVAAFRALHASGCFVLPNPWDVGSALYLRHLGFKALATTSAGFAFSKGLPDTVSAIPRDTMLAHIQQIVDATPLPVNADFQIGYAEDPQGVAANVTLCVATGAAGLSIEDSTGDPAEIAAIVRAVSPKPVNVMMSAPSPVLSVSRLTDLGVRRISVGSALARVAWGAFIRAARNISETGLFDALADAAPFADLNGIFEDPS